MFADKTLELENIEINIDSHFKGLAGLRILHFSDLHLTSPNQIFDKFFAYLNNIEYDLAIVSGDLIDNDNGIDACSKYLSRLKPKYGTFVTYGNHDKYKLGLKEYVYFYLIKKYVQKKLDFLTKRVTTNNLDLLSTKLKDKGINVLDNDLMRLDINGCKIELIGIDSPLGYDKINDSGRFKTEIIQIRGLINHAIKENYTILISHVPDLIRELDTFSINLILSSHTHGGQIRLPFFGPLLTISSFQRKYAMGIFRYNNSYLHVSSGLGASSIIPIRFGCPPRATVITLKRAK